MTGAGIVFLTTFLASTVEAIEMVTIVVGVGATRSWRSTLLGAAAGFAILAVVVVGLGAALSAIPIAPLRVLVGALLLLFGLVRVADNGLAGYQWHEADDERGPSTGVDWTAFTLSFKGVVLEGLEIALIVVSFGASAGQLGTAIFAGAGAVVVIGAIGLAVSPTVSRIPRSLLQLVVGTMLTSFGTFWALEGLGVSWPQSDLDIAALLAFYAVAAAALIERERRGTSPALKGVRS